MLGYNDVSSVKAPDVDAIRRNLRAEQTLRQAAEKVEQRVLEIERQTRSDAHPAGSAEAFELAAASTDLGRIRDELSLTERRSDRLTTDRSTWISLPTTPRPRPPS